MKKLLKTGKTAAESWGQKDKALAIAGKSELFETIATASNVEQWQINVAVHYNEWAAMHKNDFEPVATSFKKLVDELTCQKCSSIFYVTPEHGEADALRCSCGDWNVNLRKKS
jgi:hypothetical protein